MLTEKSTLRGGVGQFGLTLPRAVGVFILKGD